MECLQHVLCISCVSELGTEEEVLMCGGCKLWQHRKCTPVLPPSFYAEFYVSVLQEQKPKHWMCHYCSRNQATKAPSSLKKEKTFLAVPANPPPSEGTTDSDNQDELDMSFDITRTAREGPALYPATSLSSLEDRTTPSVVRILIHPRPALWDPSPLPITYALYKENDGQKKVKDCHGNVFTSTGVIAHRAEAYKCAYQGCHFQVRVCEDRREFLCGGTFSKDAHSHDMPLSSDSETSDNDSDAMEDDNDVSITPSLPTPGHTPYRISPRYTGSGQQTKRKSPDSMPDTDSSSNSDDQRPSPILPATPANTPARVQVAAKKTLGKHGGISSNSRSNSDDTETPAIHRFKALTTPVLNKSSANYSFSSSSDDSSDQLDMAMIRDSPAHATVSSSDTPTIVNIPPPQSNAVPACYSSDSSDSDEESEVTTITYTLNDGPASGSQARLSDSLGYTYQIKFKLGTRVFWTCTEKVGRCSATIIQLRKNQFTRGAANHNHKPNQSESTQKDNCHSSAGTHLHTQPESTLKGDCHIPAGTQLDRNLRASSKEKKTMDTCVTANSSHKPAASQSDDKPTKDVVIPASKPSTIHQSKRAKLVRSTVTESLPENVTKPAPVSRQAAKLTQPNELATTSETAEELYQEITTCTFYSFRPQSILVDSKGYIYRSKQEVTGKDVTVWRCTHKGPGGRCKGQVHFDYTTPFNKHCWEKYTWTVDHHKTAKAVHHNHEADRTAAVTIKLRAMIHQQVYGHGHHNHSAKEIIRRATESLCDWERPHVPNDRPQITSLNRFVWKQQKEYRDEPRCELDRYMIEC